jgi:RNA polymerase sigma factor (sigma-70 family)
VGEQDTDRLIELVEAARAGDRQAQDHLVAGYLPLVYNIVGRALGGNADVDDVVQETMLRAVDGLPGLRDPASFRSWLVAIAMNQIRGHWQANQTYLAHERGEGWDAFEPVDPRMDFVELTIVRLGLSGQRREVAEATRWLDAADRELLALWWLEAAGEVTRAELADALGLPPQHAAVRIQRMKGQLELSRVVVRALSSARCAELRAHAAGWEGTPSPLWRKRFARHVRECRECSGHGGDLVPAERLLVALAMVPPAAGLAALIAATRHAAAFHFAADAAPWGPSGSTSPIEHISGPQPTPRPSSAHAHRRPRTAHGIRRLASRPLLSSAAAGFTAIAAVAGIAYQTSDSVRGKSRATDSLEITQGGPTASNSPPAPTPDPSQPSMTKATTTTTATTPAGPTTSHTPTHAKPTSPTPKPPSTTGSSAPTSAPVPMPTNNASAVQQVLDLLNRARADQGLPALTITSGLTGSATKHNQTMASGCGMSHQCPGEPGLGARETAAGVHWMAAGENIGEGGPVASSDSGIASMALALTQDMLNEKPPNDGHRRNILSTSFTHVGIAVFRDSKGTVWMTQDFSD